MADIPTNTQTEQADVPLFGLVLDILEQILRVPHLTVCQDHDFEIQILEALLDGRFDSRKDLCAAKVSHHTIAVPLGFRERLVGVWAGFVPEERVVGAEGAYVEVDVDWEGLEE